MLGSDVGERFLNGWDGGLNFQSTVIQLAINFNQLQTAIVELVTPFFYDFAYLLQSLFGGYG